MTPRRNPALEDPAIHTLDVNEPLVDTLLHADPAARQHAEPLMVRLRREQLDRPVIYVGTGTCGLGAGAGETVQAIRQYLADRDQPVDLVEVGCIGLCTEEPIVDVQLPGRTRLSFAHVTQDKVQPLLQAVLEGTLPEQVEVIAQIPMAGADPWDGVPMLGDHPFFKPQRRWVLAQCGRIDPQRIEEYIAWGGYRAFARLLREKTPSEVADEVEASGLRGRGGGGFPTGKKWKFALQAPSNQKYLICNADEGDPGAFMDRAVIEGDPHRLIEGMAIAAYAIGATIAYIYIRAEYPQAIERLKGALEQARAYRLLGDNILDSGFELKINIKTGAGAFVCGEETALIHSIEGRRGMPRPRPPFPATRGLFGKPTIINNVETLANLPRIMEHGAQAFAAAGTPASKGTKVFALSGKVARTGLVEVEMGTPLSQIVFEIGGGILGGHPFKAVQIGGPSGGCIPAQHMDIQVDYESLKTVGAMMGSGGLVVMDAHTCMVDVAKFFMDFIQRESCGKCIPCREGTRRLHEILQRITRGHQSERENESLERFQGVMYMTRLAKVIQDTSLCGLGQTAPNPVLSTLRWFRDEYEAHVFERKCPAGVCKELMAYRIDPDLCKGCGLCAKVCSVGAIAGTPRSPYYIIPETCIRCGACVQSCRFGAIIAQ